MERKEFESLNSHSSSAASLATHAWKLQPCEVGDAVVPPVPAAASWFLSGFAFAWVRGGGVREGGEEGEGRGRGEGGRKQASASLLEEGRRGEGQERREEEGRWGGSARCTYRSL